MPMLFVLFCFLLEVMLVSNFLIPSNRIWSGMSRQLQTIRMQIQETLLVPSQAATRAQALQTFRPSLQLLPAPEEHQDRIVWSMFSNKMQIDSLELDLFLLRDRKASPQVIASAWDYQIKQRLEQHNLSLALQPAAKQPPDQLEQELDTALRAVRVASHISRAYQRMSIREEMSVNKLDASPVTVADFAVQAIVLSALHQAFPQDKFIAEEDAAILRSQSGLREQVLDLIEAAMGKRWSADKLYKTVDLGLYEKGSVEQSRVWVLDPIDGTKGFIRGEHYCVALALLVNGKPKLSVLGCPNLNLRKILEHDVLSQADAQSLGDIAADISVTADQQITFPSPELGTICYAVTNRGAFAQSLAMAHRAGVEVNVDSTPLDLSQNQLCESYEQAFGTREITSYIHKAWNLKSSLLRIDGQCKHAVVGMGAASATLRLPPRGYVEKIWDLAPGCHFVEEAGGKVTDLRGLPLDFSRGRMMDAAVTGVISSNGKIQDLLLEEVQRAQAMQQS